MLCAGSLSKSSSGSCGITTASGSASIIGASSDGKTLLKGSSYSWTGKPVTLTFVSNSPTFFTLSGRGAKMSVAP